MAENLVVSGIRLDTRELLQGQTRVEQSLARIDRAAGGTERQFERLNNRVDGLSRTMTRAFAAVGGFVVLRRAGRAIFRTNLEFEALEATLNSVAGTALKGERAFKLVTDFASATPFQIENLTQAFISLKAFGMDPTEKSLRGLGNLASAFTRDITDIIQAIVAVTTGVTRSIRAFGITATTEGEKVTLTFGDISRTVDKTVEGIAEAVAEIGNLKFPTAMEERVKTLEGATSNLKDATSLLIREIGKAGLNAELTTLIRLIEDNIRGGSEFADVLGKNLATGVRGATAAFEVFVRHIDAVILALQFLTGATIARGLSALTRALTSTAAAARLLAFLGGPAGILTAVAGGLAFIALTSDKTSDSARQLSKDISDLTDELVKLSSVEVGRVLAALEGRLAGLQADIAQTKSEIGGVGPRRAGIAAGLDILPGVPGAGALADLIAPSADPEKRRRLEELIQQQRVLEESLQRIKEIRDKIAAGEAAEVAAGRERQIQALNEAEARRLKQIEQLIKGLQEERIQTVEGDRALLEHTLNQLKASDADRQRALSIFDEIQAHKDRTKALEETLRALDRLSASEREFQRRVEEEAARAVAEVGRGEELARLIEQQRQLGDAAARMADQMLDAFMDVITVTDNVVDAFGKMVTGIFRELARLAARRALFNFLEGLTGGLLGNLFGRAIPAAPGPIDVAPPDIPGFQRGGTFRVGGSGGPDSQLVAFRATPGERVIVGEEPIPLGGTDRTSGTTGGNVFHVTTPVTILTPDPATLRQFVARERNVFGEAVLRAWQDAGLL